MAQVMDRQEAESVTEMAIVDTFTKLIFGQESQYSGSELGIIHALRIIDEMSLWTATAIWGCIYAPWVCRK